jgi:hypothetical protein
MVHRHYGPNPSFGPDFARIIWFPLPHNSIFSAALLASMQAGAVGFIRHDPKGTSFYSGDQT